MHNNNLSGYGNRVLDTLEKKISSQGYQVVPSGGNYCNPLTGGVKCNYALLRRGSLEPAGKLDIYFSGTMGGVRFSVLDSRGRSLKTPERGSVFYGMFGKKSTDNLDEAILLVSEQVAQLP